MLDGDNHRDSVLEAVSRGSPWAEARLVEGEATGIALQQANEVQDLDLKNKNGKVEMGEGRRGRDAASAQGHPAAGATSNDNDEQGRLWERRSGWWQWPPPELLERSSSGGV